MKRTTLFLVSLFVSGGVSAQSLSVSGTQADLKPLVAEVNQQGVVVTEQGENILSGKYTLPSVPDPSLKAFALPNGAAVVRENIANFLLFDTFWCCGCVALAITSLSSRFAPSARQPTS